MHVTSPRTLVPALLTSIAKTQWIRALSHGPAPMHVTSPMTLVPALLARHTWRNLRARMIFRHVLLVGLPISLTQESKAQTSLRQPREQRRLIREDNTLSRTKRLAKLSLKTWLNFPRWFFRLWSLASWAACTPKGSSRAPRLEGSYLFSLTPSGLVEP